MLSSLYHYFPLPLPFLFLLGVLLALAVGYIEIRTLRYAYSQMGINRRWVFALLLLSLFGSYVNIPVAELPAEYVHSGEVVTYYGMRYVIPMMERLPRTIIAVNLGGGLVPALLSIYLMYRNRLFARGAVAVAVVAFVAHDLAQPIQGVGIAIPVFVPPLAAAAVALFLSPRQAGPLAYMSGSLGTLIGADLLNLDKVQGLGAPVASIGGAGTFDGIFMSGVLGVLIASWLGLRGRRSFRPPEHRQDQPGDSTSRPAG